MMNAALQQARDDLGDHRIQDLPLSGKIVHLSRHEREKLFRAPVLTDVSSTLASWHTACVENSEKPLIRAVGLGSGGLHRLGPNYKPASAVLCIRCLQKGHKVSDCPRSQSLGASRILRSGRVVIPPVKPSKEVIQSATTHMKSDTKQVNLGDPRMQDRNWIAAYPDPTERQTAIDETSHLLQTKSRSPSARHAGTHTARIAGVARRPSAKGALLSPTRPTTASKVSSLRADNTVTSAARKIKSRMAARMTASRAAVNDKEGRRGVAAPSLSEEPFWAGSPAIENESQAVTNKTPGKPIDSIRSDRLDMSLNTTQSYTKPLEDTDVVRQSSKGYLQERPENLPAHYRKVVFPPREAQLPSDSSEDSKSDRSMSPDIYSDPGLSWSGKRKRESRSHAKLPDSKTWETTSYYSILSRLEVPGIKIIDCCEDEVSQHPSLSGQTIAKSTGKFFKPLQTTAFDGSVVHENPVSRANATLRPKKKSGQGGMSEKGPFLFVLKLSHKTWRIHLNDDPRAIAEQVCLDNCIVDDEVKKTIEAQIKEKHRARAANYH